MTFFAHWIPTFAAASVLAVAGLILRTINRRKYAERLGEGTNIVVLDPHVAAEFKDSQSVNDALRTILKTRVKQ